MPKVRVVSVPPGEAPLQVRDAWVGVEMPYNPFMTYIAAAASAVGLRNSGVLSGKEVGEEDPNEGGYAVCAGDAIAALRQHGRTEAAAWWEQHGFGRDPTDFLIFGQQFCEVVEDGMQP